MHSHDYVDNEVLHVTPVQLVCLLYAKAVEKLGQARVHLEAGRIPERSEAIGRVMEIVAELQGSLDPEQGGEIARDLDRLYIYIQERLVQANGEQTAEPIKESMRLMSTLLEGWKECRDSMDLPRVPAIPAESAQAGAVREWRL